MLRTAPFTPHSTRNTSSSPNLPTAPLPPDPRLPRLIPPRESTTANVQRDFVEALKREFPDYGLTCAVGGQISWSKFNFPRRAKIQLSSQG
ncbi:hypothetical protein BDZ91DRAFT_710474 [Kalaharituber pfeilii]|nr:hypothetical protein BDZ91DRAFT_710474 [Kalaharituber pfeilii]